MRSATPASGAALDAALRARLALGEALVEAGAAEDGLAQYRALLATPAGLVGEVMSTALKDAIKATRASATSATTALLARVGRAAEARALDRPEAA
jgi:hypothetical protein